MPEDERREVDGVTRTEALADLRLVCPTAMIVCAPEIAWGMLNWSTKEPMDVVVMVETGLVLVLSQ
jgi:hypothetical protein